ncbi:MULTISPECIES: hypothetical protein [unclassified Pseudactinotalea]|uniref:hypothetical protein n=1 Tax=unclassified Pseudactinotalea TaxID=2649176 RepID=UPI00129CC98C|nr:MULTISPECIES: hypothetical protein [unclassified Pseudactinotalea]QGH70371.1 hypothetical protein GCE65_13380 [Pseudactinotalea sp. HY158]
MSEFTMIGADEGAACVGGACALPGEAALPPDENGEKPTDDARAPSVGSTPWQD